MAHKSAEDIIRDAARIREFLNDDAISDALGRMERRYYELFVAAISAEDRVRAQAKAVVLRNFNDEMQTMIDAGEVEVLTAAKAHASRTPR